MNDISFGDLFTSIRNGLSIKQDKSGDGLPISRIETISNGIIDPSRVGYAGIQIKDGNDWLLQSGDLLFSHINSVEHIGKCAVYRDIPAQLVHGMNLLRLRPNKDRLDSNYAQWLIRSIGFRSRLSNFINKAVNQASVSTTNLRSIRVTVPSVKEQRRIAAILDQAEALRAKRRQALAKLDTLIQAQFDDVMRTQAELRLVPLEDAVEAIIDYRGKSPEKSESGVPLVTARIVKNGIILPPTEFIPERSYNAWMRRGIPRAGDVVFTSEAPLGEVARLGTERVALAQRLLVFRGKSGLLDNGFLMFVLRERSVREQIEKRSTGSTVKGIRQSELRKVRIPIPALAEQLRFSRFLDSVRNIRFQVTQGIDRVEKLSQSLQHRAFQGEL